MPHQEFAGAAWSPWTVANRETLENVQGRAIKMVSGLSSTQYEDRLKELRMVTLQEKTPTGLGPSVQAAARP